MLLFVHRVASLSRQELSLVQQEPSKNELVGFLRRSTEQLLLLSGFWRADALLILTNCVNANKQFESSSLSVT